MVGQEKKKGGFKCFWNKIGLQIIIIIISYPNPGSHMTRFLTLSEGADLKHIAVNVSFTPLALATLEQAPSLQKNQVQPNPI